jgi:HlyD family secretion protein
MNDGTTVATVADMTDLIFNGSIDETEVGALVVGMPMKITIGALPDYSSEATLEYIAPKATESNGASQFQIKAAIVPSETHTIRAGYSANAEIVLQEVKEVLSVPESALEFSADSVFVYLMTAPQVFEKTPVTTGMSDGINIHVMSGLTEGQTVRGTQNIEE